mmetsp:Transcript_45138/g.149643  ORF Transcript_45138/g.149643 Transcript_45138/m.149643 type:complete len:234 (+) Transcript_45138:641-1342(+)
MANTLPSTSDGRSASAGSAPAGSRSRSGVSGAALGATASRPDGSPRAKRDRSVVDVSFAAQARSTTANTGRETARSVWPMPPGATVTLLDSTCSSRRGLDAHSPSSAKPDQSSGGGHRVSSSATTATASASTSCLATSVGKGEGAAEEKAAEEREARRLACSATSHAAEPGSRGSHAPVPPMGESSAATSAGTKPSPQISSALPRSASAIAARACTAPPLASGGAASSRVPSM